MGRLPASFRDRHWRFESRSSAGPEQAGEGGNDAHKVAVARCNLDEAGVSSFSEVREGDALLTLKDLAAPVDLVFLDGWKDLYLPVLQLLKAKLRKGSVVVADNIRFPPIVRKTMALYVAYMNDPANGFRSVTLPIGAGIEYSVLEG